MADVPVDPPVEVKEPRIQKRVTLHSGVNNQPQTRNLLNVGWRKNFKEALDKLAAEVELGQQHAGYLDSLAKGYQVNKGIPVSKAVSPYAKGISTRNATSEDVSTGPYSQAYQDSPYIRSIEGNTELGRELGASQSRQAVPNLIAGSSSLSTQLFPTGSGKKGALLSFIRQVVPQWAGPAAAFVNDRFGQGKFKTLDTRQGGYEMEGLRLSKNVANLQQEIENARASGQQVSPELQKGIQEANQAYLKHISSEPNLFSGYQGSNFLNSEGTSLAGDAAWNTDLGINAARSYKLPLKAALPGNIVGSTIGAGLGLYTNYENRKALFEDIEKGKANGTLTPADEAAIKERIDSLGYGEAAVSGAAPVAGSALASRPFVARGIASGAGKASRLAARTPYLGKFVPKAMQGLTASSAAKLGLRGASALGAGGVSVAQGAMDLYKARDGLRNDEINANVLDEAGQNINDEAQNAGKGSWWNAAKNTGAAIGNTLTGSPIRAAEIIHGTSDEAKDLAKRTAEQNRMHVREVLNDPKERKFLSDDKDLRQADYDMRVDLAKTGMGSSYATHLLASAVNSSTGAEHISEMKRIANNIAKTQGVDINKASAIAYRRLMSNPETIKTMNVLADQVGEFAGGTLTPAGKKGLDIMALNVGPDATAEVLGRLSESDAEYLRNIIQSSGWVTQGK